MTTEDIRRAETPEDLERWVEPDVYKIWQEREGVPVIVDFAFEDLNTVELGPWPRKGGKGAIINIPNNFLPNDGHLVEIAPGGKSEPEHHLYEETMYVVSGARGHERLARPRTTSARSSGTRAAWWPSR